MASLLFIRFIKSLMVAAPFLMLILMVLALWGVGGKTTYTDLNPAIQQMEFGAGEAKNYLVKDSPNNEQPSIGLENPGICEEKETNGTAKKEPLPEKITWGRVV